ncbi:MAG: hypothetical protein WBD34_08110 [Burkholderiaceae bacterium]
MSMTPDVDTQARRARWAGSAALLFFLLFVANVIYGKWLLVQGTSLSSPMAGVPEFLLLLLSVALFVTYTLLRAGGRQSPPDP